VIDGMYLLGAGLLGLVTGLISGLAFRFSERERLGAVRPEPPELDEGVGAVLAVLPSAAVVTTLDLRVVRASAAAHAHGLVRDNRVVHAGLHEILVEVARDGEIRDIEIDLPRVVGGRGTVPFAIRIAPLGARHLLLLAEDRTEARRLDAIRQDFVANASHELKTPVGALALLAETVGEAADDPDAVRHFAERIQVEATRLTALVQDILQLSQVQAGEPPADSQGVGVHEVVQEAVDRVRTAATGRDITIEVGGEQATVRGDHGLLVTAVRNLLDNAIAYSDPGTRIGVGTTLRVDEGMVDVAVVDQGIGIPPGAQSRLFERFYRVDPARSRETGGTGLGLSIVKHVVADHGGDVTVWSEPGRGSTFTIHLPLAPERTGGEP
jgi:two-component system sensor histidine kinase SenX3